MLYDLFFLRLSSQVLLRHNCSTTALFILEIPAFILHVIHSFNLNRSFFCQDGVHRSAVHGDEAEDDLLHRFRWNYHRR